MNSHDTKQRANVSNIENQKRQKPKVKKPKKVGSKERLASPIPSEPSICHRWSPTERIFDCNGKIIKYRASKGQSDNLYGDNDVFSTLVEASGLFSWQFSSLWDRNLKLLINFVWKFLGTIHFGNDHIAVFLDLKGTDISQKDEKPSKNRQNRARDGKVAHEGYEDYATYSGKSPANKFAIKHGLLILSKQGNFLDRIKKTTAQHVISTKITSTMKITNVTTYVRLNLLLFRFLSKGAAGIGWKRPPRNEITRFQQKFDETFYEAWDRFNDLLRGCPHHGFSELHQLDTFYNALNSNDQDSLNSAAGGNFLDKMPRECLKIIESKSKVRQSRNKAVVAKMSTSSSTQQSLDGCWKIIRHGSSCGALILDMKKQTQASPP
ncbi:hypothetical protein Tco_0409834 [Tanacetum coccineum]